jgi:cold shock CspA family protein
MKYFGTVKTFDNAQGVGEITPETGGSMLRFERSAFAWESDAVPTIGQRVSYDIGTDNDRQPCALNLNTI